MTNALMQYLDAPAQPQAPTQGAGKYYGPVAEGYDAKRVNDPKWAIEQRIIEDMLSDLPEGSEVLDCPVGTGRFLDYYGRQKLKFVGADLSGDMLIQSALKLVPEEKVQAWVDECNRRNAIIPFLIEGKGTLVNGDVRQIGLPDKSVEASVMCRLTRWLSPPDCVKALRELQRVCRNRIILTARVANHPHARSIELIESALDGWVIHRNEAGYVLDYRIIELRPKAAA